MKRRIALVALLATAFVLTASSASAAPAKEIRADGSVPARWDLPKPSGGEHPDIAPVTASGTGDGSNSISFAAFDSGDIIVVTGSGTGHAGEWDSYYFRGSLYDNCIWSANTAPVNGVQREEPRKYRAYDAAYGLWVPSVTATRRGSARTYCRAQSGEPYNVASSKTDQASWYCSKLAWSSYRYTCGIDLDADGGYWVWPVDLINDSQTSCFAYSS